MRRALLVLPLLLLPACGGGDDGPSAKETYLAEAEAVCKEANAQQAAESFPTDPKALPGYVRKIVTIASDTSAELNALEPPEEDAAELDSKLLAPLREQVGLGQAFAKDVETTAAKGDTAAVLALLGRAPLQAKADLQFMEDYGFVECVKAADTSS